MNSFYTSVDRYGNNILVRGYKNGKRYQQRVPFSPTMYVPSLTQTALTSFLDGKPVQPVQLDSMAEAKDFIERYKDVGNFTVYGTTNFVTQYIHENWPDQIEFDPSLINIVSFDIEVDISSGYADVETADKEITSIAYKSTNSDTYHLLGRKDYDKTKTITGLDPEQIIYMKFQSEAELLRRFVQIWTNDYPDIVTGWNVQYFDIQYIFTRIKRIFGDNYIKKLSPWGNVRQVSADIFGNGKLHHTYKISGISVIDYMDAFKKFGYKFGTQESYKLDHIAHVVLGEKKLDYSEYGSLTELYRQNPQLYLDYNLQDTRLIERLEEETSLLSLVMTVAYGGGVNFNDAFGTVGIWESTIYRKLMNSNIVPPLKGGPGERGGGLAGGYVKDPQVGMHSWVVSFDLNSLYPMLILQYNMSPETYINDHRENVSANMVLNGQYQNNSDSFSVTANGVCFSKRQVGVIPEIIDEYYARRSKIKQRMLQTQQDLEDVENEIQKRIEKSK